MPVRIILPQHTSRLPLTAISAGADNPGIGRAELRPQLVHHGAQGGLRGSLPRALRCPGHHETDRPLVGKNKGD